MKGHAYGENWICRPRANGQRECPHLIKGGHHVTVYDVSQKAVSALEKQGATGTKSPKEAAQGCEVIFAILPIGEIVEKVVLGTDGIADGMSGNAIFVDMSCVFEQRP